MVSCLSVVESIDTGLYLVEIGGIRKHDIAKSLAIKLTLATNPTLPKSKCLVLKNLIARTIGLAYLVVENLLMR